jgi:flavin reductase (DIM6/NTAB) family NADH-FMN oxidoreductase RutF
MDETALVELGRELMSRVAAAVSVITTIDDDGIPRGMTVSSLTSVAAEPPTVLVCVGPNAKTRPAMVPGRRFCANVLAADQVDVSVGFAWGEQDPYEVFEWTANEDGVPMLAGAAAHLLCEVEKVVEHRGTGIVLARVTGGEVNKDEALVYWQRKYHTDVCGTDPDVTGSW